jgi:hypothetical protein
VASVSDVSTVPSLTRCAGLRKAAGPPRAGKGEQPCTKAPCGQS